MTQVLVLLTFTRDWGKTPGFDLMQPGSLGDEQEVEGFPVSLIVTFKQIKKKITCDKYKTLKHHYIIKK